MDRLLTTLKGVGPAAAAKLEALGLTRVQDALFHLPLRYQDRSTLHRLDQLSIGQEQRLAGEIIDQRLQLGRRRSLLVTLSDGHHQVVLRFFYFAKAMREQLAVGRYVDCFGDVRQGPSGIELVHPQWQALDCMPQSEPCATLSPVYPATEGVSQGLLSKCIDAALALVDQSPPHDYLQDHAHTRQWPTLVEALKTLHRPPLFTDLQSLSDGSHPAMQRLVLEELLAHKLALWWAKAERKKTQAPAFSPSQSLQKALRIALGFELTGAQKRVIKTLQEDLAKPQAMARLVQGDVGSGKTAVAALALCAVVEAGWQVAIMAPTELLAEQHFQVFSRWFAELEVRCTWLAGKQSAAAKREAQAQIASGEAQIVIGTHALFQDSVHYAKLGLIIIDEQHRFGVDQRRALMQKTEHLGVQAHQLAMTATPIPRTLAMTSYADIDISVIDELPPGRTPVRTVALANDRRSEVIERMDQAMSAGRQVYWVCTLIDQSEQLQAQSATEVWTQLCEALPGHAIGLIHGRMNSAEKDRVMAAFKAEQYAALVATTVIEVGVDVPNASTMIIDNAERLGLAQLHQLRGRVGRGRVQSSCVLLYQAPLSEASRSRLNALRQSNDGFWIAERDLELRGPGEILGVRQTGIAQLRVAQIIRDRALLEPVNALATELWSSEPSAVRGLIERWVGHDALKLSKV